MERCRFGLMIRRSWSMVGRSGLIRFGLIMRILGLTLISDIGNISSVCISN